MTNYYRAWGFSDSPFATTSLEPNKRGFTLLTGRDEELRILRLRLTVPGKWICIDGPNGVGKTSLANVAAYTCYHDYIEKRGTTQLIIPCKSAFQFDPQGSAEKFTFNALLAIAQTLIQEAKRVRGLALDLKELRAMDHWINSPVLSSWEAGLGGLINAGAGTSPNETAGFHFEGFANQVFQWLDEVFRGGAEGGVVCVLDNMELLQTSSEAKQILETLRDPLLTRPGLRWVMAGANGILPTVASPRLDGFLMKPIIHLEEVKENKAGELLDRRVRAYAIDEPYATTYLPFTAKDFETLYGILAHNLRNLLSYVGDYCRWTVEKEVQPKTDDDKSHLFKKWIDAEALEIYTRVRDLTGVRAWEVFNKAIELTSFSPAEFEKLGCTSIQHLRGLVRPLEEANLVQSIRDENDQRRKTISVTDKGYLAKYAEMFLT